ncbi:MULTISPECIES: DNA translocase FtsK [unclassified Guyparkeria]|uniref:DNA translocase FtsK n=1 Tax=unclassified Guyparkeria TaxID=2626246 RepID=UPI00073357D2|nr:MULTISPECIES: DNA translocase FtsK [unclassified Guyparkeria]KTG17800.1 cell division protein FtsK [Guyparkeria sp. XI15]OAE89511.1 cell division protein FtsK [Guyparkeria sp. WRN-7]
MPGMTKPAIFRPQLALLELALLVVSLMLGVYLLALLSYVPSDPGFSVTGGQVQNAAGLVGAWVADASRYLVGLGAYMVVPALLPLLWRTFRRARQGLPWADLPFAVQWLGALLLVLCVSVLAAINHAPFSSPDGLSAGGVVGLVLAEGMVRLLGALGSTLVLLGLGMLGISATTGLSWFALFDLIGALLIRAWEGLRAAGGWVAKRMPWSRKTGAKPIPEVGASYAEVEQRRRKQEPKVDPPVAKPAPTKPAPAKTPPKAAPKKTPAGKPPQPELGTADGKPILELLDRPVQQSSGFDKDDLQRMSEVIEARLSEFGVSVEVVAAHPGPVITRFELQPAPGVKVSQISNLAKDLARALSIVSVRVVEVIPGKSTVGLEIPNTSREIIALRELLESRRYREARSPLTVALGKDIGGEPIMADLSRMPHLLVAGTTGSGKSVGVNAMILSLLYKATAEEVRLILIDPKMLELSVYEGISHLLAPVVTDMKEASNALRWAVGEMERRYRLMAKLGVRNIAGANEKIREAIARGEPIKDPFYDHAQAFDPDQPPPTLEPMPYLVIVVDEFADMMMVVGKKVEELIARLAQKARAAGIHLILATQRPSVDVITGLIKANIPTRIAFQVSSKVDSRTILDQMGAEHLLGHGDMLYLPPGSGMPMRVHGAFVDDEEVHRVVEALKTLGEPEYVDEVLSEATAANVTLPGEKPVRADGEEVDELYDQAVAIVTESRKASISYVQRRLKIGYNRSARLVEQMEADGVVGELGANGSREVLAPPPPR